jgi:hypothetical protein
MECWAVTSPKPGTTVDAARQAEARLGRHLVLRLPEHHRPPAYCVEPVGCIRTKLGQPFVIDRGSRGRTIGSTPLTPMIPRPRLGNSTDAAMPSLPMAAPWVAAEKFSIGAALAGGTATKLTTEAIWVNLKLFTSGLRHVPTGPHFGRVRPPGSLGCFTSSSTEGISARGSLECKRWSCTPLGQLSRHD